MRCLKWSLIIDVINTKKDVFPNLKLKAEVILIPTTPQPHAHSLLLGIEFKVTIFPSLNTIFELTGGGANRTRVR